MKIYQVGGAVRDFLRQENPHDTDYVVVGSSPSEMKRLGFKEVGKGFPVFLHPQTKEEYALARKETKIGRKHTDFEFIFTPEITLREDLQRRDFTCNALAKDPTTGTITDYFGGMQDIRHKILRHIDCRHFTEDPLRALRLCRFVAQLDFTPAPDTLALCKKMVADKMLEDLSAERIWIEIFKALRTKAFDRFIGSMREIGALEALLPEVETLWQGEATRAQLLQERLKAAAEATPEVKFALLFQDVPEAKKILPQLYRRLRVPHRFCVLAGLMYKNIDSWQKINAQNIDFVFDLTQSLTYEHISYVPDFIVYATILATPDTSDSDFRQKAELMTFVAQKAAQIRASDMPDFARLPKNADFKAKLRAYKIQKIAESLGQ